MDHACANAVLCKAIASTLTAAKLCWFQHTEVQAKTADGVLGTQAGVPWLNCSQQV